MIFLFLDGDVPCSTSYGVYISKLIHFARATSHIDDFNTHYKVLIAKLLKKDINIITFVRVRHFQNFVNGILTYCLNITVGLKTLLLQGLSEPDLYGDLVY